MGSSKHRWKLSFHHRAPSSPLWKPNPLPELPPEGFLCPISGEIMADPVILPSGDTFERACIQASADLGFTPHPLPSPPTHPLLLIPNSALLSAILSWCDRSTHPRPTPVPHSAALAIVGRLMKTTPPQPHHLKSSPSSPLSSYNSSSSSSSIDEGVSPNPSPEEDKILTGIMDPRVSEQEAALRALRRATRESPEQRASLCTPRVLSALRPLLVSPHQGVRTNAVASVVNLSVDRENKVRIVRSCAVPALVDTLRCGIPEARDHAAAAMFSLAMEEENRAAIGALGGVPPLLHLLACSNEIPRARRDAGMALYHLTLLGASRSKVARAPGAVRTVLGVAAAAAADDVTGLRRVALMVLCNITGSTEGRGVMMDAGAVDTLVNILRTEKEKREVREYCVAALYAMSRGSLRFRGLGRAAGAEEVMASAGEDEGIGEAAREMARRTVRSISGEEMEEEITVEGSVVSDGVLSFRGRISDLASASGANSAEF